MPKINLRVKDLSHFDVVCGESFVPRQIDIIFGQPVNLFLGKSKKRKLSKRTKKPI